MPGYVEGGINGGGDLVVGRVKFVGGLRTKVLAKLAGKSKECEVTGINIPLGLF